MVLVTRNVVKTIASVCLDAQKNRLTISLHLQTLKAERLIEAEKEGLYVKYCLADETVCEFFRGRSGPSDTEA